MNIGFATASGKCVKVSEQALEKARQLFEVIEEEQQRAEEADDAAVPSVDTVTSFSTPTRSVESFGRVGELRRAQPFRPQAFRSPRRLNEESTAWTPSGDVRASQLDVVVQEQVTPQRTNVLSTLNAPVTPSIPSRSGDERRSITPIKLLTPYCKYWRLCVKIICKEEMRQFRGTNVFSFWGVDDDGVEIRICAFNQLAHKVAELVKLDQMYYITRASVRTAAKRFKRNQYDMEIIVRDETEIIECTDRPEISSSKIRFNFVRIKNLWKFIDAEVDVIGVVKETGEVKNLTGKMGKALFKRELQIVDDSACAVMVALWGECAKNFTTATEVPVIIAKRVFVRSYQGSITLSVSGSSKLDVDMDLPEVDSLRRWYNGNRHASFASLSNELVLSYNEHKWIGQVKPTESVLYFNVTAIVMNVNVDNAVYKGCVNEGCRKKLIEADGKFECPKCGTASDDYKYFYTLSVELCDMTGTHWASLFDDCAEKLLGQPADEVVKVRNYNYDAYTAQFRTPLFKTYAFRVVARRHDNETSTSAERSQQQFGTSTLPASKVAARAVSRMRWCVVDLMPVNYDTYIKFLERSLWPLTPK
ncbi:Replication protein A 70 kDa DNA-binding subunit [Toxocara canis]|uniref:Replication protein A 70 kDa DNA-binding subunit n=1 Tax=Toxocara canis TaxID=6265 RepID=A0A0B2W6Y8_TOXCA|nr:Replication protein A 70 kDa DNA-binding subunit [Toxocara canis]